MQVAKMSGGERARLALALITRDAPHMLILDEPTNHLDVDAREALVQALNDYSGAVVLVSHDRHMLELTADRLVLVDGGTATRICRQPRRLYRPHPRPETRRAAATGRRRSATARTSAAPPPRRASAASRCARPAQAAETEMARLEARKTEIERAMFDPSSAAPADAALTDERADEAPRRDLGRSRRGRGALARGERSDGGGAGGLSVSCRRSARGRHGGPPCRTGPSAASAGNARAGLPREASLGRVHPPRRRRA